MSFIDYEVSNEGRVRRITATRRTLANHVMTLQKESTGEYRLILRHEGVQHRFTIHSLVADAFIGQRPLGLTIDHLDADRSNNHATNLEYCTQKENTLRAIRMGLRVPLKGERHPMSKLTKGQVEWIRITLRENLISKGDIARILNVTRSLINAIEQQKLWK